MADSTSSWQIFLKENSEKVIKLFKECAKSDKPTEDHTYLLLKVDGFPVKMKNGEYIALASTHFIKTRGREIMVYRWNIFAYLAHLYMQSD